MVTFCSLFKQFLTIISITFYITQRHLGLFKSLSTLDLYQTVIEPDILKLDVKELERSLAAMLTKSSNVLIFKISCAFLCVNVLPSRLRSKVSFVKCGVDARAYISKKRIPGAHWFLKNSCSRKSRSLL